MIILSTTNVSLRFGTTTIFENISFAADEHDKIGVIGVNGCGKTSLFKVITGEYEPTEGEVFLSKGKSIGILTQEGAFDENGADGSGEENALEHMVHAFPALLQAEKELQDLQEALNAGAEAAGGDEAYDRLTRAFAAKNEAFIQDGGLEFRGRCLGILRKLGFDDELCEKPVKYLSGGQKTRLALGIQLSRAPDLLLLDEPTNHLDIETLGWLERCLSDYAGCVLVISHDRYFLDRVTRKTLCLQNHHARLYNGNYTESMKKREADRETEEKHYREQQKEIARQEAYIAQQRAWNRERNIVAAESRQKMLDKMVRIEKPERAPKPIALRFTAGQPSGNDVLYVKHVSMGFDGQELFSRLSFTVKRNDRLLILGRNGCGKSTLIKLLIGALNPTAGRIEAGYHVEIGYYDQENQQLDPDSSVLDELWDAYPQLTETEIRTTLGHFRFVGDEVYKTVGMLSGGERARLTLAKLILSKMNLLVLDEPTNHLDIDSREALETALEGFGGTIVAVSHDRYFIEKLASRIIEITPDEGATLIDGKSGGDFTDYRVEHPGQAYTEYRAFADARADMRKNAEPAVPAGPNEEPSPSEPLSAGDAYRKARQSAAEIRKRENHRKRLVKESADLEAEIDRIDAELEGPAATDYIRAGELCDRKDALEEKLLSVYEELEEFPESTEAES